MIEKPIKIFSNGTEFLLFQDWNCERCKRYVFDKDNGYPAYPKDGGCKTLDAIYNAMFDESQFPSSDIVEQYDDNGNLQCSFKCKKFLSEDVPDEIDDGVDWDIPGQVCLTVEGEQGVIKQ